MWAPNQLMSGHDSLQEKMAEASFAWLSVVVKRKIVKVGWESNFGSSLA